MGKRKTLSIGPLAAVPLEKAREARDQAKAYIRDGRDPMAEKKVAKLTAELKHRQIFGLIADELIEKLKREGKAPAMIAKREWLLKSLAKDLRDRPIAHIRRLKSSPSCVRPRAADIWRRRVGFAPPSGRSCGWLSPQTGRREIQRPLSAARSRYRA